MRACRLSIAVSIAVSLVTISGCGDDAGATTAGGGDGGRTPTSTSTTDAGGTRSATAGGGDGSGGSGDGSGGDGSGGSPTTSGADGGGTGDGGATPVSTTPYVYVGDGDGVIERWLLDRETGALNALGAEDVGGAPSFLAASPDGKHLYAVDESQSQVMAFSIDPQTGDLTEIGTRRSSEGSGPAYVSVDRSGAWVLVANYGGGTVAVLPVGIDGSLGDAVAVESPGDNPHLIRTDPSNQYVFVPCLGSDHVAQYFFDEATGQLALHGNAPLPAGTGPRHLEFHPTLPLVYVIGEQGDSLTTFRLDEGLLTDPVTISTLPEGQDGDGNACADLHVHPSGTVLYGSNRGFDTIAAFALDAEGAAAAPVQTSVDGSWPRNFGLDAEGGILLVANQHTDEIVTFRMDAITGALTQLATTPTGSGPAWVGVVGQPAD